jgi:hypothetical protein
MRRKYLRTLVALALLGSLWGSYTYISKRQSREPVPSESKPQEKLFPINSQQIDSFELKPKDGEALTCQRKTREWAIVKPRDLPADQSSISSLLDTLTAATVDEVIDPHPADLKQFGLDSPVETLDVTSNGKPQKFELRLGEETPTGAGVYAQVAGSPRVIKLAAYMKSSLVKSLFDLRDRRVVTLQPDQIQRIEVTGKDTGYTLAKNPEGVWDLVLPPPVRADRFGVDGLVNQLRDLKMQSIVAEQKSGMEVRYGLKAPLLVVHLNGPGARETISLGAKAPGKDQSRYCAVNSALAPVFTLNADFLNQFRKHADEFRDKDLFTFSTFDAQHVEIEMPTGRLVFDLQKDKWNQTVPKSRDEPTSKMQDLLNELRDLRAASFPKGLSLAAAGLAKPAYRFGVRYGEKKQTETVEISKVGEHVYARRSTDPLPCELAKTAPASLEKALSDLTGGK